MCIYIYIYIYIRIMLTTRIAAPLSTYDGRTSAG